jgi:ADP-heptose:LPS heptosyltransferase
MKTTFILDGGAGRLITAIPALEKYAINNPQDDFRVLTAAWESLYWCHPLLQAKTFNVNQKGAFDFHMKDRRLVHPEPYMLNDYYNQRIHLIEAFDREINQTDSHEDLDKPNLYLSRTETSKAREVIKQLRESQNKRRVIVVQPYGSGMAARDGKPSDATHRSLDVDFYLQLAYRLSKNNIVIFFGEKEFFHPVDRYSINFFDSNPDMRMYMTLISECDYFLGVDSVGQHMARAFNKPGMVILGSTFEENVSYPEHFKIYRNKYRPTYVPIRISGIDCDFSNNLNENVMEFTDEDLERIVGEIDER